MEHETNANNEEEYTLAEILDEEESYEFEESEWDDFEEYMEAF